MRLAFKDFFRKKTDPTTTTKLLTNSTRQSAPTLSESELQRFYSEVPYLNLMVRKIAEGVSQVEWKVYREVAGKKMKLDDHPLLDLIDGFNPLMSTGIEGWYAIQTWLELNGNAYLMIERDKQGVPTFLWAINPTDVRELPNINNEFCYIVDINNAPQKIFLTEIVHLKNIDHRNIYGKGIGTIHSMLNVLQTSKYSQEQVVNYFYNQAVPPYIVGADVSPDQLKELKKSWDLNNQGFWNRHKPYFTNTTNIQIQKLTDTFNDMQMLQILENGAETIRQLFGIPPEIIGKVENSNRATIQGAREIFAKEVLMFRLRRIQETLNNTLVREFGDDIFIEFTSPVPSDKEFILRGMQHFPNEFKVNEVRELLGYEPDYERGDEYITQTNTHLLEKDNMPINRADNPKSDKDIRRENEEG